ncbi:MAG: hypothetical protein ACRD5Z_25600 [Bryobacteraceae bacterium]
MKNIRSYVVISLLALAGIGAGITVAQNSKKQSEAPTGTVKTLIVAHGSIGMNLDLSRLNGKGQAALAFQAVPNSFFPIVVFNDQLRGAEEGSIQLKPDHSVALPGKLNVAKDRLVLEKLPYADRFDLAVRDGKTGFVFFNVEGHSYSYNAATQSLRLDGGRLLVAQGFAQSLGRPQETDAVVGGISVTAQLRPIEVRKVVNGVDQSAVLPPADAPTALSNGPDIIVGDLPSMIEDGSSGTQVGLSVGTTSCNAGTVEVDWFAIPNNDHPVIPQNFYRMSGGATNDARFEQVGQSWLKHAFEALQDNACSFGCTPAANGTHLGVGCSDPYDASLNGTQSQLGSRAWVNPFTGVFPSGTTPRNHTGHVHTGTTHRILVEGSDLQASANPGATYYAEAQYVTPQEYTWCQSHPGECNMYNNASYRRFNVTTNSPTSFSFSPVGATVRMTPAVYGWTGATINTVEPEPGNDGRAYLAYKVTGPDNGVYHYEYAIYNQNLDRAIQSFSVPLGCNVTISNPGFHAPLNPPGIANDGTPNDAGYSNAAWTASQSATDVSWSCETLAQNPNANALRWGTLYNFRFDSDRAPQAAQATIGFYKTGDPITVAIQAPMPDTTCSPLSLLGAVSRKTHGSAGDFDIALPLSGDPGVECRRGTVAGEHTLVFTFSNDVVSGNASVAGGGQVAGSPVFSGNTMTVNLSGVPNATQITVTLTDVMDSSAQKLPDTTVSMKALLGDIDGNSSVSSNDVGRVKSQVSNDVTADNFRADVIANGLINSTDVSAVKAQSGTGLP